MMEIISNCRKQSVEDEQNRRDIKRKKVDLFMFLPDDIVVDIFKKLPDVFLGYRARYVCKRWWDLISNRIFPYRASFILSGIGFSTARHVGIKEEGEELGLQVKVQDVDIPRIGIVMSWVNEFLLIVSDYKQKKGSLYVYNLITKKGSYLPKCNNTSCEGDCSSFKCGVALSFDGFKGTYKVVHIFSGPPIECHILILRKDNNIVSSKWKKIQVPNRMNDGNWLFLAHNPVSVKGRYIHWRVQRDNKCLISMDTVKEEIVDKRLICMDTVNEKIVDLILPVHCHNRMDYTIFEMGGSLALFAGVSQDKAEIWILKDLQTNKWEKLQSVAFDKWYHRGFPLV